MPAPAPTTCDQFLAAVHKSGLLAEPVLHEYLDKRSAAGAPASPAELAAALVRDGLLTRFQCQQVQAGKSRGFFIGGKYKLLEFLGAGGMGSVYLCEHTAMRRWVALKVLPTNLGKDTSYLERFFREARAVARLDHPNIVRAHDVDHDGKLHFLVMEYVDGSSLQEIVDRHGPLDPLRAAHYIRQAAQGLQHAHEAGLVHRDVKPGNLLLDRQGTVKLLDLGLARFFHEDDGLSKKYDENVLGTTDYLAPEQVIDGKVDIRADLYALGATFYYLLTGKTFFGSAKTTAKLVWQQVRKPKPIRSRRPEVPAELAALIEEKLLAKEPEQRFQDPAEVCAALAPWTATPIGPPPPAEMPELCPALRGGCQSAACPTPLPDRPQARSSAQKAWTISGATSLSATPAPVDLLPATAVKPRPVTPPSSRSARISPPRRRAALGRYGPLVLGAATALGLVLLLVPLGLWWALAALGGGGPGRGHEPAVARPGLVAPAVAPPPGEVVLAADAEGQHVRTASYEAHVGPDGNLASLRVGGVEFLKPGVQFGPNVSRGSYFYYTEDAGPGVVKLPTLERLAGNRIKASGDRFSIVYEFGPDSITLQLTNATDHTVPFYLVFDTPVSAVMNEQGEPAALPATLPWPTTTWFAERSRLGVTGATRLWGPWMQGYQVCEATLATYETRRLTLTAGRASDTDIARIAAIQASAGAHRIERPGYEAVVEADGCLTSLRVHGVEFLRPGPDISRGLYLHNGKGVVALPDLAQPEPHVITAAGAEASIRYEFANDAIVRTVANKTNGALACFLVFDPAIAALRDGAGAWSKLPVDQPADDARHGTTTWFAPGARLQATGGSRVWGPWTAQKLQVWEASLRPQETRRLVLSAGVPSAAETAEVAKLTGKPPARADFGLACPTDWQVFQRSTRLQGAVRLRGRVQVPCDQLLARLSGKSLDGTLPDRWQEVTLAAGTRAFDQLVPAEAGGWYRLELRAYKDAQVVATTAVEHVGIGEVFITAGQSNSTNCSPDRMRPASGLVAGFDGYHWGPGDDPQPGVHDNSGGGSCWPAFGDALVDRYRVPVGIASTGHSGTSVNQWQPGGPLFKWTLGRMNQLGPRGFRAVLWHQGESDVGLSADEYADRLATVIRATRRSAGWEVPWCVARVSYHNPQHTSFGTTRDGQKKLWDSGVALEGPDTDMLAGDHRSENGQGIHFSAKGNRAHGRLWADRVGVYLDRAMTK